VVNIICTASKDVCPGAVISSDPPSGTVDARQPHDLNDASALLGIGGRTEPITIDVGAAGADSSCWSLCETGDGGHGANSIDSVVDNGDGTYTLTLARPISAGETTTISYDGELATTLIAHPGNVDADTFTAVADILKIVDALNLVFVLPHGVYSGDIDHSGAVGASDIIREIDVINGASELEVWNGTPKPDGECP